ncbi:MAG: DUF4755 domain-containing protein [Terracidiphilus sp.]
MKALLMMLAYLLGFPAIVGLILWICGFTNFPHNLHYFGYGLFWMAPEGVVIWSLYRYYTRGRESFYAALPAGTRFRYFSESTGIAIDEINRVLILQSGTFTARYDFKAIRSVEWHLHEGGKVVAPGAGVRASFEAGAHNIANLVENEDHSGLFVTVSDLERPIWQVRMTSEKELRHWNAILSQTALA